MFELGGMTVTWGTLVLVALLTAGIAWFAWRGPYAVVALGALIGGIHAVAYWTEYLDAAAVADVRGTVAGLAVEAFLVAAAGLDTLFAATGTAIGWLLDWLAGISMPAASVSVLEFGSFLLAVTLAGALVCASLVRIVRWAEGTPIGAWLAGLGVVFGASGVLWTWLPIGIGEMAALHALLIAVALVAGIGVGALAVRTPTPALQRQLRTHR
ncbi:hypothetical protein [Halalkalicoccus tibetensis]|uniref:Uncharacterized protein n=1 Tax=Halalkalicoccus tibetensis TaxID=175632 RepID=A0ABD5V4S0_9EURY